MYTQLTAKNWEKETKFDGSCYMDEHFTKLLESGNLFFKKDITITLTPREVLEIENALLTIQELPLDYKDVCERQEQLRIFNRILDKLKLITNGEHK